MSTENSTALTRALNRSVKLQHNVTFRFNKATSSMLSDCIAAAEQHNGSHISRSALIRLLIDMHAELCLKDKELPITTLASPGDNLALWLKQPLISQVSLTITEHHRVTLRKLEFEIQKLDWSILVDRNATIQLLIMAYGKDLQSHLSTLD